MVNTKEALLAVLPVVTELPPPLRNQPAFVPSDPGISPALLTACELERSYKRRESHPDRPRPTQGGERISVDWLQTLTDRECLWRFRCVVISHDVHYSNT